MALTDVQICANALIRLGARPISSFEESGDPPTICANVYPAKKEHILSVYDWDFTTSKVQLARLTAPPATEWKYQFQFPGDALQRKPIEVYNTDQEGAVPIKTFEVVGNVLMTNEEEIYIDYQQATDEANWPPYFTELMIKVMMVELALPITDQQGTRDKLEREVYGPDPDVIGGMLLKAMNRNSANKPGEAISSFPLIEARFGGGL